LPCVFVYGTPAQFKPSAFCEWKTQTQMWAATWKGDSNPSRHYLPLIRASNGWINKSLFRIVFGEGIVPAVLPLGAWLELRESTLCNTPGGYEEQMSCLLPSKLKSAHTSLKRTSWKVEPRKLQEFFCIYFWEVVGGFKGKLICCRPCLLQPGVIHSAHRAPSGQLE